jgi:hypothetical protein
MPMARGAVAHGPGPVWSGPRRTRRAHQVAVAFAGGAAAFVEGPDDQALAAAAVAGGEDALEVGRVLLVLGLDVAAGVALDAELLEQRLLGPEEAHRQQHELRGRTCSVPGTSLGTNWPLSLLLPLDLDGDEFLHAARVVADEFLDRGEIDARVGAEFGGGLLLAVIHLVDLGPFGPGIVGGALQRRLGQDLDLHEALAAVAQGEVPTQSVPVSPPPMTTTSLPRGMRWAAVRGLPSSRALVLAVRNSIAKWTPLRLRPSTGRSRGLVAPVQRTTASNSFRKIAGIDVVADVGVADELDAFLLHEAMRRSTTSCLSSFMFGMPYMSRPPGRGRRARRR